MRPFFSGAVGLVLAGGAVACSDSSVKSPVSPACSFGVTVGSSVFSGAGGSSQVSVVAPAGCAWSATSSMDWLRITSGAAGSGDGTVTLAVGPHEGAAERSAVLTIAQQTFNITQRTCAARIRPSELIVGNNDTAAEITVEADAGCRWEAAATVDWISVEPSSGIGTSAVTVSVEDNPSLDREGAVLLNSTRALGVRQSSGPCTFELSVTPAAFDVAGGSGTLRVQTREGCQWRVESAGDWVRLGGSAEGDGPAEIPVTVAANAGAADRRATLRAGERVTEISQRGQTSCEYRVDPVQIIVPVDGHDGSVSVTTAPGCAWTAANAEPFVRLRGQTSQVGSGSVAYTMAAHPGPGYYNGFRRSPIQIRWDAPTQGQNAWLLQVPDCSTVFFLPPQSGFIGEVSFNADGGRQVVFTQTESPFGCPWRVEGGADWLHTTALSRGPDEFGFARGDGQIVLTVQPNPSASPRSTVLTAGGRRTLTVLQAGR